MTPAQTHVAAIDIGTNSTRLLLADGSGAWVDKRATVTRLGEGVDATGEFGQAPMERTWAVLASYGETLRQFEVSAVRAVATSACRDASNRDVFLDTAAELIGVRPEVIGGEEEAELAFRGARAGLPSSPAPFAVIDVGGGSTEIVVGDRSPTYARSFDIGSVRTSERLAPNRPMPEDQWEAARAWATEVFSEVEIGEEPNTVVGVAGTFTSLAAIHLDLDHYDPHEVEGTEISLAALWGMASTLGAMDTAAVAAIPSVESARAYVLPAGAIVACSAVEALGSDSVIVSEHDNLDGIVAGLLSAFG